MNLDLAKSIDRSVGRWMARVLHWFSRLVRLSRGRGEVHEVRSILVVKLWGMGNLVLLDPVIRAVRRAYPGSEITLLTLEGNREIAERHPDVDFVETFDVRSFLGLWMELPRTILALRSRRPDLVLDFEQFCHLSGILVTLARPRQTIGFGLPGRWRGAIYNVRVPYREDRHMVEIFADVARAAGARITGPLRLVPLALEQEDVEAAARLLDGSETEASGARWIAVHPGSGDNFPGRRWPIESFSALVSRLLEHDPGLRVAVTGAASEGELAEFLSSGLSAEARARVADLTGRTRPGVLAALLARCQLLISNDTGPLHLAGAMGVPVVGFFGPNTPRLYGPLGRRSMAFYADLPCSPCITNENAKSSSCRMPVCMRAIEPAAVLERIIGSGLLEGASGSEECSRGGAHEAGGAVGAAPSEQRIGRGRR